MYNSENMHGENETAPYYYANDTMYAIGTFNISMMLEFNTTISNYTTYYFDEQYYSSTDNPTGIFWLVSILQLSVTIAMNIDSLTKPNTKM